MLGIFHETEAELYPARDPKVIACQSAFDAARREAEPAARAWHTYCTAHPDEVGAPFRREKQRLYEAVTDTAEVVEHAEAALRHARDAATTKATEGWDEHVRRDVLVDLPAIEAFIALLQRHEATAVEAELAGVTHPLRVSQVFITSTEVATRLAYAKKELGLVE